MGDCFAAGAEAARGKSGRHIGDMAVQASLGNERTGEKRRGQKAERQTQQCGLDQECERADDGEQDQNGGGAGRTPRG